MHPILHGRRALLAYVAAWVALAYVPASLLAAPGGGRFLLALGAAAPATLAFGVAALPLYYVCRALPLRPANTGRVVRVQLGLALAWSLGWLVLLELTATAVGWAAGVDLAREVERRGAALLALGGVLHLGVTAFHYAVAATSQARGAEARAAAAALQLREARLALLQAQVHPHFLFNSLHAVSALTVADPTGARDLCLLLADYLRASLALGARGEVSFAEEVRLARTYLEIERVRLGARLVLDLQVSPDAGEVTVPALLLQPLVENAITHGVATRREGGVVAIAAHTTSAMLVITVTNPFDPLAPPRRGGRGGVGLANVSRRLAACYRGATLETARASERFTATLTLPARRGDALEVGHADLAG